MKWLRSAEEARAAREWERLAGEAARGRALVEESREVVVVLDRERRVVAASRRARESLEGLELGEPLPQGTDRGRRPIEIPYEVLGSGETLVYLSEPSENAAYEELRAGFTAAVSHELRTPLARLLAILESVELPGSDPVELARQARREVEDIRELIDDVLFLSELETGRQVVSLGQTRVLEVVEEVAASLAASAERAGVAIRTHGDASVSVPMRPRMLHVVVSNLAANAVRYAGEGSSLTLSVERRGDHALLTAADTGRGVSDEDVPRLFERFYRADRARATRGTGLGLSIVKHVVSSAGGDVEAEGGLGRGLTIRCRLPLAQPARPAPGTHAAARRGL